MTRRFTHLIAHLAFLLVASCGSSAESESSASIEHKSPDGMAELQVFSDCEQCPEMAVMPKGEIQAESEQTEPDQKSNENSYTDLDLDPFAIGVYEVTVGQWKACVDAGHCDKIGYHVLLKDTQPAASITWDQAVQYTGWLSATTGKYYRLPTEAEWEYAERAGTQTTYITGQSLSDGFGNYSGAGNKNSVPIGSFSPNAFGLYDMLGNLSEWTQDCYSNQIGTGRYIEDTCEQRAVRGCDFASHKDDCRSDFRFPYPSYSDSVRLGFRVAASLDPEKD